NGRFNCALTLIVKRAFKVCIQDADAWSAAQARLYAQDSRPCVKRERGRIRPCPKRRIQFGGELRTRLRFAPFWRCAPARPIRPTWAPATRARRLRLR